MLIRVGRLMGSPLATASSTIQNLILALSGGFNYFRPTDTGDVPPQSVVAGALTGMVNPLGVFVDTVHQEVYVVEGTSSTTTLMSVFQQGATGDPTTVRVFFGNQTLLYLCNTIFVDTVHDEIYVVSNRTSIGQAQVQVFSRTGFGNIGPVRKFTSSSSLSGQTGLGTSVRGLYVDPVGNEIYLCSQNSAGYVAVFPRTSNGNVAPTRVLSGQTDFANGVYGIGVDLVNSEIFAKIAGKVLVFNTSDSGSTAPKRLFTSSYIVEPYGGMIINLVSDTITFGSSDEGSNNDILTYARTQTGTNITPLLRISGASTGLDFIEDVCHAQVPTPLPHVWTQQAKLAGTGGTGLGSQGTSVALSSDGSTAIVGAPIDNSSQGGIYVFTRSGVTWTQQGGFLVPSPLIPGGSLAGFSVSVSGDGNTAVVGAKGDNSGIGGCFVFVRSSGTWTQQGGKLLGTGATGASQQGVSVSVSSDGTTLAIGGNEDNSGAGAAWIFTRTGTTWTQQGSLLTASDGDGGQELGRGVALSSDGNTLALGGPNYGGEDGSQGGIWIFTRSGSTWTQQGSRLLGSSPGGDLEQGISVAISSDGNTLLSGCTTADSGVAGLYVFTRTGTTWTQQGAKIRPTGFLASSFNSSSFGSSVALSADGNTAVGGGLGDECQLTIKTGSANVFTRSAGVWTQFNSKSVATGANDSPLDLGTGVAISGDGLTMIAGGPLENGSDGASWVFTYV